MEKTPRSVTLLLNVAHGIDHMFLLIFATAVASIAVDFGYTKWEDLMPYAVGAFAMFGPALFLMAVRLQLLLAAGGVTVPFLTLVRLHYLGFFFNTFIIDSPLMEGGISFSASCNRE